MHTIVDEVRTGYLVGVVLRLVLFISIRIGL